MEIVTNNRYRPLLGWYNLTEKERKEFDYSAAAFGTYFRYRGMVFSTSEFSTIAIPGWHGVMNETAFSGVLIRIHAYTVAVGRYIS